MKLLSLSRLIFVLSLISCESEITIKTGTYTYSPLTKCEMGFRYIFQDVRGSICSERNLIINDDSSYILTKYPFIVTGKWDYNEDSLILFISEYKWIDDSLKLKYPPDKIPKIVSESIVYKVKGDKLMRFSPIGNNKKIIVKLKFNTP